MDLGPSMERLVYPTNQLYHLRTKCHEHGICLMKFRSVWMMSKLSMSICSDWSTFTLNYADYPPPPPHTHTHWIVLFCDPGVLMVPSVLVKLEYFNDLTVSSIIYVSFHCNLAFIIIGCRKYNDQR